MQDPKSHLSYLSLCFLSGMLFQNLTDFMVAVQLSNIIRRQTILKREYTVHHVSLIANISQLVVHLVLEVDLSTFGNEQLDNFDVPLSGGKE